MTKRMLITADGAGLRLDGAMLPLTPGMGLRGRRRLCGLGGVLVNGRPAAAAFRVRAGDVVELVEDDMPERAETPRADMRDGDPGRFAEPYVVCATEHLAALYKPAGLHTEVLAGKRDRSLQGLLPGLLSVTGEGWPRLVNRLDCPTSGLTMAALDPEGEAAWRIAQSDGRTEKRYLALLEGELKEERIVRQRLALKGRARVLVELADHPDVRRHTCLIPLAVMDEADSALFSEASPAASVRGRAGKFAGRVTLAGCVILKGARHQIRAHASAQGFPLWGDFRYGSSRASGASAGGGAEDPPRAEEERFFLHHGRIIMPEFSALCLPPWLSLLPEIAARAGRVWLES